MRAKTVPELVAAPLDDFPVSPVVDLAVAEAPGNALDGAPLTLGSAFGHYPRLLLLGLPGAGKTTALLAMTRDAAAERRLDDRAPLPVLVHLGGWKGERPLTTWLRQKAGVPAAAEDEPKLYLLDGLDEVMDFSGRLAPAAQQKDLLDAIDADLGFAPLVLSCRAQDYHSIGRRANLDGAITLLPLQPEEVERYLRARGLPSLWDAATHDRELLGLLQTPLLLAVATVAWREAGPSEAISQASLFDQFVRGRFKHERSRLVPVPYDEETTRRRLGDRGARIELMAEEDESLADRAHAAIEEDFSAFAERMHFLQGGISGGRQFLHRKLEDFFALPALEELAACTQHLRVAKWIHFFAERIGAPAAPLLGRELRDADKGRRESAADALAGIEDPAVVPLLLDAAASDDHYIRRLGEDAITRIGAAALPALHEALVGDDDKIAWRATWGLIRVGLPAVSVLRHLTGHSRPRARQNALFALRELGSAQAVPEVQSCLDDNNAEVRATALETYVALVDGVSAGRAGRRSLDDSAEVVRLSAAFVCCFPVIVAAMTDHERVQTVGHLVRLLNDDVPAVGRRAARSLVVLGGLQAAGALERSLIEGSEEIRLALVMELARTPFSSLADPLGVSAKVS